MGCKGVFVIRTCFRDGSGICNWICIFSSHCREMHPKYADRIVSSADPDQSSFRSGSTPCALVFLSKNLEKKYTKRSKWKWKIGKRTSRWQECKLNYAETRQGLRKGWQRDCTMANQNQKMPDTRRKKAVQYCYIQHKYVYPLKKHLWTCFMAV